MGVTIPRYRIGEAFHRAKDLKFGRTLHAQQLRGAWRSWEKMFENRDNKIEICVYLVICINVYLCVLLNDVWAHPCIYYIIVLLYIMCMYYFVHKYTDVCVCVRAYAFVPAHVTWHSCLLEPIMRCSKDMFPKSLQIFHPAVDILLTIMFVRLQIGLRYSPCNSWLDPCPYLPPLKLNWCFHNPH